MKWSLAACMYVRFTSQLNGWLWCVYGVYSHLSFAQCGSLQMIHLVFCSKHSLHTYVHTNVLACTHIVSMLHSPVSSTFHFQHACRCERMWGSRNVQPVLFQQPGELLLLMCRWVHPAIRRQHLQGKRWSRLPPSSRPTLNSKDSDQQRLRHFGGRHYFSSQPAPNTGHWCWHQVHSTHSLLYLTILPYNRAT